MAGSLQLLTLLGAAYILITTVSSETTKLKSNPDGNFAIGFSKGYISSGKYGVIVPKGDDDDKREVQIQGEGVQDSIYMQFNKHTIVFSTWEGMFMLGDMVYTDTLGTLYFVRSDKKCVKKVYKFQVGEVQVIGKDKLDKSQCDEVRAKVESALSHYLTTPFNYELPTASAKLQKTPGFPGGDFVKGLKHGTIHCGQHTVVVPSGDEDKERLIQVKAPGVLDEIKMIFDSDTKVFCNWEGLFYLGDKVFSVEYKTLIIQKNDGACVKKIFETHGGEIVVKQSTMLKEEDCFLIRSKAFASMEQLIKPGDIIKEEKKNQAAKLTPRKSQTQLTPEKSKPNGSYLKVESIKKIPLEPPPPIHVTSTVVIPKQDQPTPQLIPAIATTPTTVAPSQTSQLYTVQNSNQFQSQKVLTLSPSDINILQGSAVNTQTSGLYMPTETIQAPSETVFVQPNSLLNEQVQYGNTLSPIPNDFTLGGTNKVVNLQKNTIDLNTESSPFMFKNFDSSDQIVPEGYVRVARAISQEAQPANVFNNQQTTIDASAIAKAREGSVPTKITGIQKSNVFSPLGVNGLPLTSDMRATQITTVTIPPDNKKPPLRPYQYKGNEGEQQLFINTNVILDQDSNPKQSPNPIRMATVIPQTVKLVAQPASQVINLQKNHININEPGRVTNVQRNIVNLQDFQTTETTKVINLQENNVNIDQPGEVKNIQINRPTLHTQDMPIVVKETSPPVLLRVGRSITQPSRVVNFQDNDLNLDTPGEVKNIQKNTVDIKGSHTAYVLDPLQRNVMFRVRRHISPYVYVKEPEPLISRKVLNFQNNAVNLNGQSEIKNIQKNNVIDKSADNAVLLQENIPDAIFPVRRSTPLRSFIHNLNVPERKVVNIQDNNILLNEEGEVRNVQNNNVDIKRQETPMFIKKMAPEVLVRVARSIPNNAYLQNLEIPEPRKVTNYQENIVNSDGPGETKNIQKNNVAASSPRSSYIIKSLPDALVRAGRSIPQNMYVQNSVLPLKGVLNLQNNDVNLEGPGDISNIQKNHVNLNDEKGSLILQETSPDGLVRVARDVQQQYNKGSSSVYQPNNIITLQGNDVVAPIGANGYAIMPNLKSSQLTKLTLPQQEGSLNGPQQMFIKTNVLLKQNDAQVNQGVPIYQTVQSPSVTVNSIPTAMKLTPSTQTLVLPSSTAPPSGQSLYLKNGNPQMILSGNIPQPQPQIYNYQTNNVPTPLSQAVSNVQLNNLQQGTPAVSVNQVNPSMAKMGPYFVVPARSQGSSSINFYPNGATKLNLGNRGGNSMVVNAPLTVSSGTPTQGHIPVTLMKDLTMLKHMYNPSSMIVNIAESTNFHKK